MLDQAVWRRPRAHFLELRQEVFQAFNFDRKATIVFSALVGWHQVKDNEADRDGETFDGWMTFGREDIWRSCFGLVCERNVEEALVVLRDAGFLEVQEDSPKFEKRRYRLLIDNINSTLMALPATNDVPKKSNMAYVGKNAHEDSGEQNCSRQETDSTIAVGKNAHDYKEEGSITREREKETLPPVSPPEEVEPLQGTGEPTAGFDDLLRQWKRTTGVKKPNAGDRAYAAERWPADESVSQALVDELIAWGVREKRSLVQVVYGIRSRVDAPTFRPARGKNNNSLPRNLPAVQSPPPRTTELPAEALRWNGEAKNCPSYEILTSDDQIALSEFRKQPNATAIMDRCFPLCDKMGDVSFGFFLRKWEKLLNGDFNFKLPRAAPANGNRYKSKSEKIDDAVAEVRRRLAIEFANKKEAAHGTK